MGYTAFIDESGSNRSVDPHAYILAAAVLEDADVEAAAEAMDSLRLRGQTKVHWRDESPSRRLKLVEALMSLEAMGVVVVRSGLEGERDERRRRLCAERLFYELVAQGVQDAVFESRGRADDARDRALLDTLRARRQIPTSFRIDHQLGRDQPLLWVADILCGAVTSHRTGDPFFLDRLGSIVDVVEIHT